MRKSLIFAVDFDGTLCWNCYPDIGTENRNLIRWLIEARDNGDKIILWTCRVGKELEDAVAWCKKRGLIFDAVNENLPEIVEAFGGSDSRKIFANVYLDDLAIRMENTSYGYKEFLDEYERLFGWRENE